MELKEIYAFDECSLLHLCRIKIPPAFRVFFEKESISHKNCEKLNNLINYLILTNYTRAKFVPSENFEKNIFRSYNQLLEKQGNVGILGASFKKEVLDQLSKFYEEIIPKFIEISKDKNIDLLKSIFNKNVKNIKKDPKIPEDDDLAILLGYSKIKVLGSKYLISEDEHFYGYSELINSNLGIKVIEEWNCHKLVK